MMTRSGKVRLVVGLFGTAEELSSGLIELGTQGLKQAQINLIAQADALLGTIGRWSESEAARSLAGWIVCRPVDGAVSLAIAAAEPGQVASTTAEQDVRALLGLRHWALRRQAQQLHRHLREGGALLLVEPGDDAEKRASCKALLRHASGGVQTHEITRPQGP